VHSNEAVGSTEKMLKSRTLHGVVWRYYKGCYGNWML